MTVPTMPNTSAFPTPSDGTGSPLNIPVPTSPGPAIGDIALLAAELNGGTSPAFSYPSGFTQKADVVNANLKLRVAWKRLTAVDTGQYAITYTSSGEFRQGHCALIRGAIASGDPFEDIQSAIVSSSLAQPPVTVTCSADSLLVHFWALLNFRVSTPPTGYTRARDTNYLDTAWQVPAAGGSNTVTGGTVPTVTDHISILAAIKAAAGGGPPAFVGWGVPL